MSYINDYEFGKQEEIYCLPILQKHCKGIKLNKDRFNRWDAENSKMLIEIKSRNFFSNQYDTTLISTKKIDQGFLETKNVAFVFNFLDGLYFIPLSDKFKTYQTKVIKVKSRIGIQEEFESKTYIPISDLILLHSKNLFID